ncbi:hypothetical protein [Stutzerimonas stutzeri]|uniref:hypothetical protein n=1 Tax=Stutzerimonas stutzeri TaxID=316 RepID=UPI001E78C186|nr:hypothetical protein [Stutzerimonas stutzeri]CAB5555871.1 Uncharacterised protein [Stutzerimonas stutzeri]CAB5597559.1 Uncharacterised protein [Stutzerimonas stutzeri]CAC9158438.1 Uncharacterised protein [Stutzerimonas stutzeri]CAD0188285.1 Hypothetical_protein [Stutzerimonas stutzeri]
MSTKKTFCIVPSKYASLISAWEGSEQENRQYLQSRAVLMELEAEDEEAALRKYLAINEGVTPSIAPV